MFILSRHLERRNNWPLKRRMWMVGFALHASLISDCAYQPPPALRKSGYNPGCTACHWSQSPGFKWGSSCTLVFASFDPNPAFWWFLKHSDCHLIKCKNNLSNNFSDLLGTSASVLQLSNLERKKLEEADELQLLTKLTTWWFSIIQSPTSSVWVWPIYG